MQDEGRGRGGVLAPGAPTEPDRTTAPSQAAAPTPRPMIAALTGLRAVAEVWVVLFHYHGDILTPVSAARYRTVWQKRASKPGKSMRS